MHSVPNRLDNLRTLRYANLDGAFATAFATLVGGTFMVGFVKQLGGSDLWIGILTAIPSLLGIVQIPGAVMGRSRPGFKGFVLPGGLAWRIFYIPLIALPLVALAADVKLWVLGSLIAIASLCVLMVNPTYNDWLASLVPESSRGWFFSRRNAILAGVGTAVGLLGGIILDAMKRAGNAEQGFAAVFGLGIVCAALSFLFFLRMTDAQRPNPVRQSMTEAISAMKAPFANRNFRKVILFFTVFIFAQAFPGNLFGAFALESLHLPFTIIQLCGMAQAVGSIIAARSWGYLADKYGNRPLLMLLGIGIATTPICWAFTRPDDLIWNTSILLVGHIFSGVIWGGVMVCQFNLLLATADADDRATYIGVGMATQAIIGGIAPLAGAYIMATFRESLGGFGAYHVIFWSTVGLRLVASVFLLPVKEPNSVSIRETVRKLRSITPKGYAALRSLATSDTPLQRQEAIEEVATRRFSIATEEIIIALHDPSPRVRRHAAMALAKLGDQSAVMALVHQLDDHPDLVEDETIEALGDLGSEQAVPALIRHLHSPRSSTRRAAAKSLGKIGALVATVPLMKAASDLGDADLRRASLQALRIMGAVEAEEVILQALLDPYPSVRIAAAEAVDELNLTAALPILRESMMRFDDEAESEIAYTLGGVGEFSDVPAILTEASKCVSVTTRRRCLLGVAKLLGVETEVYRLMHLQGMSRDSAVVEQWNSITKKNRRLMAALHRFAAGDEKGAIEAAVKATQSDELASLLGYEVDEVFLLVVAWVKKNEKE